MPACGGAPYNPKSATKVLLFWRKCKSFVILFDFLVVRVRGLGSENSGLVAGGGMKEVGWYPTEIKKNFGVRPRSALNADGIDKEIKARLLGTQRKKVHLLGGYEQATLNDASAS